MAVMTLIGVMAPPRGRLGGGNKIARFVKLDITRIETKEKNQKRQNDGR